MPISLVTGGAGFIGSHLTNDLLKLGHKVIVLDDLSGGLEENVNKEAIFIKGSINDTLLIKNLFEKHEFDYVYHLAAYAAEGLSHFIRRFNYENNLTGSINLINESIRHKIKCFVFTSSIAVYGELKPPMKEVDNPKPEDPYGIAKYAVELDLIAAQKMFGLDYIIFRPHNVYGEFQNVADKYRNVIGIFMNQLMQGKPLSVFGDGKQTRAFSYVGDVAPYIASSVNVSAARNQIFNIGADKEYTVKELATAVMQAMQINGDVIHLEARNEVEHAYADHSKAVSLLGINSFTPLSVGLKKMADWAKSFPPKKSKSFSNIEITEKIPPFWLEEN